MTYISDLAEYIVGTIGLSSPVDKRPNEETYIALLGYMRDALPLSIQSAHDQGQMIISPEKRLLDILYEAMQDARLIYDAKSIRDLGIEVVRTHIEIAQLMQQIQKARYDPRVEVRQKFLRHWIERRSSLLAKSPLLGGL